MNHRVFSLLMVLVIAGLPSGAAVVSVNFSGGQGSEPGGIPLSASDMAGDPTTPESFVANWNDASASTPVALPCVTAGAIEVPTDADWFQFVAAAGTQYVFETALGTLADTVLTLYDTDGITSLAEDDNGGVGNASRILYTFNAPGTYYLRVRSYGSPHVGTYTLSVAAVVGAAELAITRVSGTQVAISWNPPLGILQETAAISATPTWVDSPNQANPGTNTISGHKFFSVRDGIPSNCVGYVSLSLTTTFSLIANQLDDKRGNLVTNLFTGLPNQTVIYKFNGFSYDSLTYLETRGWTPSAHHQMTLAPGEGVLVKKPAAASSITVVFIGEVMEGNLTYPVPLGFGIYGGMVPQAGGITSVHNYLPANQDVVYRFNGVAYFSKTWLQALNRWNPAGEPVVDVGEPVFINSRTVKNWVRTFHVD